MKKSTFKLKGSGKKTGSKKILTAGIVLLIMALGVTSYIYIKHRDKQANLAAQQKARDEAQTESAKNQESQEASEEKGNSNSSLTTTDTVPTSDTASVVITGFAQSGGQVRATAAISGGQADKCVFTYTAQDSRPVVKQVSASNNSCSSSISEVEFDMIGARNLNVTAYIGSTKTEVNKSVTIE